MFGWIKDALDNDKLVLGHLMTDEMKLQSEIWWNCKTNKMVGFASSGLNTDGLDLANELKKMLKDVESSGGAPKWEEEPALYVNQWRFRDCYNNTHNAEFFFNNGSLTGDELL